MPADCKFYDYTYEIKNHVLTKGDEIGLDKLPEMEKTLAKEVAKR